MGNILDDSGVLSLCLRGLERLRFGCSVLGMTSAMFLLASPAAEGRVPSGLRTDGMTVVSIRAERAYHPPPLPPLHTPYPAHIARIADNTAWRVSGQTDMQRYCQQAAMPYATAARRFKNIASRKNGGHWNGRFSRPAGSAPSGMERMPVHWTADSTLPQWQAKGRMRLRNDMRALFSLSFTPLEIIAAYRRYLRPYATRGKNALTLRGMPFTGACG